MRAILFLFSCLLAGVLTGAQADSLPELGDASQATLSPAQERALGFSIMRQIQSLPSYISDPEITDYLNRIGYRLVAVSPNARQPFRFFALMDSTVNAFALPGGFIGVHSGLVLTTQSESELAAVLSHEIAHVTQKHIARLIAAQQRQGIASMAAIALAILAARSNPQAAAGAIAATQAQALSDQLAFTRDNEREADRIGLEIMERANFDPHAMPEFLERLQKATSVMESSAPSYLRTHPITYERIADIQNRTFDLPYRQIPDSLEFQLVRAKLRAMQKDPRDAVAFYDDVLKEHKYTNEVVARYGLVEALRRAEMLDRLPGELAKLMKIAPAHPMIAGLEARCDVALGHREQALATYAKALADFPNTRALIYDYAGLLIDTGHAERANAVLDDRMRDDPDDGRLYEIQARAYASLGKTMLKHRSLAEAYVASGDIGQALEQLQLALRARDGTFYDVSSVEARMRQLRALTAARR
ncbi:MAG: M48 family metalloprotease [Betaproteobacteria bacterium]|nr:M48 family metalloprotease [Betaproteobacteria bacterium]